MKKHRTHISLGVADSARSTAFYEALLGSQPASQNANVIVFEFEEPPLLLVLEVRTGKAAPKARFALVVAEPEQVGRAAVALWRIKAPLRLQDEGLEATDPDGNAWKVQFVPFTRRVEVVTMATESRDARQ